MFGVIRDRILYKYQHEGPFVRQRIMTMFVLNAIMTLVFLVFAAMRFATGVWANGLGMIVIACAMVAGNIALIRGGFKISSLLVQVITILAVVMIVLLKPDTGVVILFIAACYLMAAFTLLPLVAFSRWQISLSIVAGDLVLVYLWFSRVRVSGTENLVDLIILAGLVSFAGLFINRSFIVQITTLSLLEADAQRENQRFSALSALITSSSDSFAVGRILNEAALSTRKHVQSVHESALHLREGLAGVQEHVASGAENGQILLETEAQTDEKLQYQDTVIGSTIASIRTVETRVESLNQQARARNATLQDLVQKSGEGEVRVQSTLERFDRVAASSDKVLAIIAVIEDIAARTNLLAMNAAIEAAHAGEKGKGFAVVANEIRKLAMETNQNSRNVRDNLALNVREIHGVLEEGEGLRKIFLDFSRSIHTLHDELDETFRSIDDLAGQTRIISQAVGDLDNSRQDLRSAIARMQSSTEATRNNLDGIRSTVAELGGGVDRIADASTALQTEADRLAEIGRENIATMGHLESGLQAVQALEGSK